MTTRPYTWRCVHIDLAVSNLFECKIYGPKQVVLASFRSQQRGKQDHGCERTFALVRSVKGKTFGNQASRDNSGEHHAENLLFHVEVMRRLEFKANKYHASF